jgi:DNA-directed RNA polymerase subunit F
MEEVKKKQAISLSEVKEILGKVDVEEMDQIQRWIKFNVGHMITFQNSYQLMLKKQKK